MSEKCRLLYNFALAERRKEWELNNLRYDFEVFPWGKTCYIVGYNKQQNDLPYIKAKYPGYACVHSKVLQMTLRTLNADYSSFFSLRTNGDTKSKPPGFKGKKYFTTMTHNQSGFKITQNTITLTQFYNINIPLTFEIPATSEQFGRVYQVSVFKDKSKYYLQSRRDHCKKKSRKHNHIHQSMTKRQKKGSNQIKDIQHKLSRKMIDNTKANTIIVGDLDVKEMAQSKKATNGLNRTDNFAVT